MVKLNKFVDWDMKNLVEWLNANKISLTVQKTEMIIFPLGIEIDENLNWKHHVNDITVKLNRVNTLLFKIRDFVNINTLKTIYILCNFYFTC